MFMRTESSRQGTGINSAVFHISATHTPILILLFLGGVGGGVGVSLCIEV